MAKPLNNIDLPAAPTAQVGKLIAELCPEGVAVKSIGEICQINRGRVMSKDYLRDNAGEYPVYSSQTVDDGVFGRINTYDYDGKYLTWTTDGANAGSIFYRNGKFSITNVCGLLKVKVDGVNTKFLLYILATVSKQYVSAGMGNPKIMSNVMEKIKIPIPPLAIQQDIVKILDTFTTLEAELEARKKQYEYYRDELLTFGENVEWKLLGEVGTLIRGNGLQKKDFVEEGVGCIHYGQIYTYYGTYADKTKTFVSPELAKKLKKAQKGDVLISGVSENIEDVCKPLGWLGDEICISGDMFAFRHNQNTKFITYLLQTTNFKRYKERFAHGAKVIRVKQDKIFGDKLHTYTIVDAIADRNVLPFKVDYISTVREAEDIEDKKVRDIDRENALAAPERLANIVQYIRDHFDQKTKRNSYYKLKDRRLAGFNSIFAISFIDAAKKYYAEFQKQLSGAPSDKKLKIAIIYSFGVNEEEIDLPAQAGGVIDENSEDTSGLDKSSRDFLESAIKDYNAMFGTSCDTSSDKFQNYYKDVSERVKNREVDILLVVNMFLTGFDATTLNTLWVDKNLRLHGLLQAFSRTNRILNTVKTFGNIVCFRNMEKATNESIALFGDKEASGLVLLKSYDEYYNGYKDLSAGQAGGYKEVRGYTSLIEELLAKFPVGAGIIGEQNQKDFIRLYGAILRVRNILVTFDEFSDNEILTERDIQDYHSAYIDLYNELRKTDECEKENINDDLVFEMELIKQIEINIDYILGLVTKYHEDHIKNRELLVDINKAIDSSVELRNKKDLINQFIASLDIHSVVDEDWRKYVEKKKIEKLEEIIKHENLDHDETYKFVRNAFRNGSVATTGTDLAKVLPPVSRFSPGGERSKKRESVLDKLTRFFERFFDISGGVL